MSRTVADRIAELLGFEAEKADEAADVDCLRWLIRSQLDQLPLPGSGATLDRWRALAAVAQFDLSLAKFYEGHTDALAILAELQEPGVVPASGAWCVWAAEAPGGRAVIQAQGDGTVLLQGFKHWCSGAATSDHALLTAWKEDGAGPYLLRLSLDQPGISIDTSKWKAVGMAKSASVNIAFAGVRVEVVGEAGSYLNRPGFWQGGAGVAACWFGGAVVIALALKKSILQGVPSTRSVYQLASLGKVELALHETASILRHAAQWIDTYPAGDAVHVALQARLSAERCSKLVIDEVGKTLGASPFCLDEKFARATADLPVFIRQSHAEKDFAALGEYALAADRNAWTL